MFSAVRQNVARIFLPKDTKFEPPDQYLLQVCTEAAYENVKLTDRLYESVRSGSSAFGMIDYHNAFNAAIILELGCLCRHSGTSTYASPKIGHIFDVLQHASFSGNDFARDCSTVLKDFRQLCERLTQAMSRRISANISNSLLMRSAEIPFGMPAGSFEMTTPPMMGSALDDFLSPGLDFDKVLEEFNSWLEEGPF